MNALSDNMIRQDRASSCSSAVRFKTTDEVLDGYLTCTPLAHALHRAAEAHQLAKIALPGPVLDLGCGTGEFASLAMNGRLDMGVDLNARALDKAARTDRYHSLECADARQLPFADDQFQTVLSVSVLEHVPQPSLALAEVYRVLRPGGRFVATVVLADLHQHLFYPRILRRLRANGLANWYCWVQDHLLHHRSLMSRSRWGELLRAAGFAAFGSRPILTPRLTTSWDRLLLAALPYRAGLRIAWHPRWFRRLAVHGYRDTVRERSVEGSNLLIVARKPRGAGRFSGTRPIQATRVPHEAVSHACLS
jgi:SAM-dependent methyltransferase